MSPHRTLDTEDLEIGEAEGAVRAKQSRRHVLIGLHVVENKIALRNLREAYAIRFTGLAAHGGGTEILRHLGMNIDTPNVTRFVLLH